MHKRYSVVSKNKYVMRNILNRNFKTQFSLQQVVSGYRGYVIWQACLSLVDADTLPSITRHRPLFIIPVSIPRPITAMQKSRKLIKENIFRYAHIRSCVLFPCIVILNNGIIHCCHHQFCRSCFHVSMYIHIPYVIIILFVCHAKISQKILLLL